MKKILSHIMLLATTMAAMTTLTSCEEEDDYIAQQLRDRDWQGYVGTFYSSRWGLSGNEYATVMRFWSSGNYYTSGKGEELDYDTRSRRNDYAYCTFRWFIVDGDITLIYDDDKWTPLYIIDYHLNSEHFWGYIRDYNRSLQFDLYCNPSTSTWNSSYWDDYSDTGSYGDFTWSRTLEQPMDDDDDSTWQAVPANVPFLDRTEIARQQSGDPEAVSIASGVFAEAMSSR